MIVWNRRAGKDKTCFNYIIRRAFEKVGTYYYFLPEYSQAKKVIWENIDNDGIRMLSHVPKEIVKNLNNSELKIELINGSIVQLVGADTFDKSGVGANPIGVVFSEYSVTSPDAWNFVAPILAANGGWAIFNFTPRGKNHAYELLEKAKDNPKWFTQVLTVDDTHVLTDEALDEEKRNHPASIIQQEYYCSFLEGAGQFFRRIKHNTYDHTKILPEQGDFQIGVDLAKYQDWTVLTPFNLNFFIAYPQERFNQVDWNLQKARIEAMARRHSSIDVQQTALIWPDATGLGDPIVEDLRARGLRIGGENGEGFRFTESSRTNLLNNLAILLEQDKIKIPDEEGLISELERFQYTLTERGKIRVGVPENMHDDRVMSLALSVWGIGAPIGRDNYSYNRVMQNRAESRSFT